MVIVLTLVVKLQYNELSAKELKDIINTRGLASASSTLELLGAEVKAGSDSEAMDMLEV